MRAGHLGREALALMGDRVYNRELEFTWVASSSRMHEANSFIMHMTRTRAACGAQKK